VMPSAAGKRCSGMCD